MISVIVNRKPICISEYGATHYTITDDSYYVDFAVCKINDYSVTSDEDVLSAYSSGINEDWFLSEVEKMSGSQNATLTFNYKHFISEGKMHVDLDFFSNNLGLDVICENSGEATLAKDEKRITLPIVKKDKERTFYDRKYSIKGIQ